MEHKKFLEMEEIIDMYLDDKEATRELALEIAKFLEKENLLQNGFYIKSPTKLVTDKDFENYEKNKIKTFC